MKPFVCVRIKMFLPLSPFWGPKECILLSVLNHFVIKTRSESVFLCLKNPFLKCRYTNLYIFVFMKPFEKLKKSIGKRVIDLDLRGRKWQEKTTQ